MSVPPPDLSIEIAPLLLADMSASDALRAALQVPLHLRFYGMRASTLLASVLLVRDAELRAQSAAWLDDVLQGYAALAGLLDAVPGRAPEGLHPIVVEIVADVMPRHPDARDAIRGYEALVREHARRIDAGGEPPADGFDEVMRFLCITFHPAVRRLSSAMAEAGESFRARRDIAAMRARDRALEARGRIDDISRTVRLISLNARVEAARAGGAGRAFGVIAEEIKSLSEQTEAASEELAASVQAMMANVRSL